MSVLEGTLESASGARFRRGEPQVEFSLPRGFEPIELAGMGAFAEVWKVLDLRSGRTCALKRLRPERCQDPTARQIVLNEWQAFLSVESPHFLRFLKGDPRGEAPYLVFDWVNGRTLEEELCDQGPLTLRRAVWMARQCADGLQALERVGLAHGDIKPQNIFITLGGEVKLLDLGFVRPIRTVPNAADGHDLAGTPEYMPPEALCREATPPVSRDMYSLGVTLYRMLTGRLPFVGATPSAVMLEQRKNRPTLLRHFRPDAPRELVQIVGQLLAKQPLRRPQNLRCLIRELVDLELTLLSAEFTDEG